MKKLLLAISLAITLLLAGCSGESGKNIAKPENALIVDGVTNYVITRPDMATDSVTNIAVGFRKTLTELVGFEMEMKTDFYKAGNPMFAIPDFEILIGVNERDVTAEFETQAPRADDWLIARKGGKVLIYGTNKLQDAVDYFIANYVIDGNIYIPDGELYVNVADYKYDTLTLGGVDLTECTIEYLSTSDAAKNCANALASEISNGYGKPIKVKASSTIPAKAEKTIFIAVDETLDYDRIACEVSGSSIIVRSGLLASLETGLDMILAKMNENTQNKVLDMSTVAFNEKATSDKLNIADDAFLASLDKKQQEMKDAVLNTESQYDKEKAKRIFYVSNDGDDNNDGLSPEKPIKTIGKVNSLIYVNGDVVLFRRGDLFRGNITMKTGVTYSAYGEGAKPIISASKKNYADPALWKKTEYENVWACTETLTNVGIVALDHTGELGKYDELVGKRKVAGVGEFIGAQSMKEDLEVWSDLETNILYFYSEQNPGERFESIEIGQRGNVFSGGASNVTIDNLHITLTGSHGVGTGGVKNLTVRNCIFNWLGGSILTGFGGGNTTGYGNAVEIYGSVDGYYVYNNWIYQIYDTGITHQFSRTETTKVNNHNDVNYYDNLIEYCHWSIEYYNSTGGEGTSRKTTNINVHDNYCRMGGYGWGGRSLTGTPMYCIGAQADVTENYVTKNNIFENCLGPLVTSYGAKLTPGYTFESNTYVQPYNYIFLQVEGNHNFDGSAPEKLEKYIGETDPKCYFIMPEEDAEEKK